ncbi:hypothetical protein B0H11DRAFT_2277862 [Mycena galericulata]|nr:hypothetical protein B0H11DRAFT_2277862 [Mycena galericulata]
MAGLNHNARFDSLPALTVFVRPGQSACHPLLYKDAPTVADSKPPTFILHSHSMAVLKRKKATQRRNVFRAPSPTPSPAPTPAPSFNLQFTKKPAPAPAPAGGKQAAAAGKGQKNAPQKHPDLIAAAHLAQKKKLLLDKTRVNIQKNIQKALSPMGPLVHVGNLDPAVTSDELKRHFAAAGAVESVTIRYSAGLKGVVPYTYAIVVFETRHDARAALDLDGTQVMGSQHCMVVEPALQELPEIRKLIAASEKPVVARRMPIFAPIQTASGLTQPLGLQKTEVWTARPEVLRSQRRAKGKRIRVGDQSFTMTLA